MMVSSGLGQTSTGQGGVVDDVHGHASQQAAGHPGTDVAGHHDHGRAQCLGLFVDGPGHVGGELEVGLGLDPEIAQTGAGIDHRGVDQVGLVGVEGVDHLHQPRLQAPVGGHAGHLGQDLARPFGAVERDQHASLLRPLRRAAPTHHHHRSVQAVQEVLAGAAQHGGAQARTAVGRQAHQGVGTGVDGGRGDAVSHPVAGLGHHQRGRDRDLVDAGRPPAGGSGRRPRRWRRRTPGPAGSSCPARGPRPEPRAAPLRRTRSHPEGRRRWTWLEPHSDSRGGSATAGRSSPARASNLTLPSARPGT